jgi:hypothetical protein
MWLIMTCVLFGAGVFEPNNTAHGRKYFAPVVASITELDDVDFPVEWGVDVFIKFKGADVFEFKGTDVFNLY